MRRPAVDIYWLGGRFVVCVAALVSFAMVVPAFFTIPVSFSSTRYIIFPPKTLSLRWYEAYFTIPEWTSATGFSVLLACLTMVVTLALGLPAAFGLARGTFRGKKAMTLLFVVPLMIPVILIAMAEYFFLIDLGLVGTTTGLVIAHTVFAMPFVIIIVHATLQGFDRNYELAAMSLGASPITTFWYVTLPLIRPGVLSAALLAFLASFNEFLISLFVIGQAGTTLPIQFWKGIRFESNPTIAAASSLFIVLTITTLLLLQLVRWRTQRREVVDRRFVDTAQTTASTVEGSVQR